jgi:sortase (surface protein transpeptidase)
MRPSLRHSSPLQCRRHLAAALALVGVGLVAAAATLVATDSSSGAFIDRSAQMERALPVPSARAVAAALSAGKDAERRPAPRLNKKKRKKSPVRKQMPAPKRLLIPAIRVSARIIPVGLNRNRTIQVPKSFTVAGWFRPGPEPGERGAAVIIGHVDSVRGPGVFFHLRALRRGDGIKVVLKKTKKQRKAKSLRFIVTATREVSKQRFPTKLVYARTKRPTLRLITCGGRFNSATHHYVDNFIVFAALVGRR